MYLKFEQLNNQFNEAFDYAINLFNNAHLFVITSSQGISLMANTMCYSILIPQLSPNYKNMLNLDLFESYDTKLKSNLSENEKSLVKNWLDLKVNVLQRLKPHNPSKLPDLKQQFVDLVNSYRSTIEDKLDLVFHTEYTRLYSENPSWFKHRAISQSDLFIDIIKHALEKDSRTRLAFINLGWMNKELKFTIAFSCIIEGTSLKQNLLSIYDKNIFEDEQQKKYAFVN